MIDTPTLTANLYDVLQVQRTAMPEVVRAAYRALAWKFHPDRGESSGRMVAINEAYQTLGDPARRAAYDTASAAPRVAAPAPTPPATVIDFGRYAGWPIGRLVDEDPDYLRWLARTPVGRRLAPEIDAALSGRDLQAQHLAPRPAPAKRSLFASLGTKG